MSILTLLFVFSFKTELKGNKFFLMIKTAYKIDSDVWKLV